MFTHYYVFDEYKHFIFNTNDYLVFQYKCSYALLLVSMWFV